MIFGSQYKAGFRTHGSRDTAAPQWRLKLLLIFSAQHLELVLTLFIFIIKQGFPSGYPKVGSVMPEQF